MIALAIVAACILLVAAGQIFSVISPPPAVSGTPIRYITNTKGHWQPGDSIYDADTQAKLIALSYAFYDTSDEDLRVKIADIAYDLRSNAGLIGDDCLIEDAAVVPLGQKLDQAFGPGELSKEKLSELAHPYVDINPSGASQAGVTTTTYTFGKVDIITTQTTTISVIGSEIALKDNIALTMKAHYKAYIIYSVGWENDCLDAVNALDATGIPASDTGTVSITSNYKFIDAWNSVDKTPEGLSVPYVIIDTHATPDALDSDRFLIFSYNLSLLQNKRIDHLILLGCNAGHMDFAQTNPAAFLVQKIYGGFLLASDGTVFNIGADQNGALQYESRNDDAFRFYTDRKNRHDLGRNNLGWMVYRHVGGQTTIYSMSAYTLTVPGILDYFKPVLIA